MLVLLIVSCWILRVLAKELVSGLLHPLEERSLCWPSGLISWSIMESAEELLDMADQK